MKSAVKRLVVLYVCIIILFVLFRVLSSLVPHHLVRDNIKKSYSSFTEYSKVGLSLSEWDGSNQLDGVSEFDLLASAISTTGAEPIKEALGNYVVKEYGYSGIETMRYLKDMETSETRMAEKMYKPTYWWGIQILIRPLLAMFSYSAAIKILQLIMLFLGAVLFYLISTKIGMIEGMLFVFSLWSINIMVVTMSFFFASTFLVALSICIYMFFVKDLKENYIYIFGVSGMWTAYFDWATATTVPLTLPLVVCFLILAKNEEISMKSGVRMGICAPIIWGAGYIMTIATKWVLASLVGFDAWGMALKRVVSGMGDINEDWLPSEPLALMITSIKSNYEQLSFAVIARYSDKAKELAVIIILVIVFAFLFRKKGKLPLYLFILALYPIVQFAILRGHNSIHNWFTYRSAVTTVWAVLLMIYYLIDYEKLKNFRLYKKGRACQ